MKTERHPNRTNAHAPLDIDRVEELLDRLEVGTGDCDVPGCVHHAASVAPTAELRTI